MNAVLKLGLGPDDVVADEKAGRNHGGDKSEQDRGGQVAGRKDALEKAAGAAPESLIADAGCLRRTHARSTAFQRLPQPISLMLRL